MRGMVLHTRKIILSETTRPGWAIRPVTAAEGGRTVEYRVLPAVVTGGRCLCPFEFQLMARRGHFGTRDISRRIVPPPDGNGDRSRSV